MDSFAQKSGAGIPFAALFRQFRAIIHPQNAGSAKRRIHRKATQQFAA